MTSPTPTKIICVNCNHGALYHHCEIVQEKINEYEPNATFTGVRSLVPYHKTELRRDWRFLWLKKTNCTITEIKSSVIFFLSAYNSHKKIFVPREQYSSMSAEDIYTFIYPHLQAMYNANPPQKT